MSRIRWSSTGGIPCPSFTAALRWNRSNRSYTDIATLSADLLPSAPCPSSDVSPTLLRHLTVVVALRFVFKPATTESRLALCSCTIELFVVDPFIMASLILHRAATKLDCGSGLIIEVDDLLLVLVSTEQCFVEDTISSSPSIVEEGSAAELSELSSLARATFDQDQGGIILSRAAQSRGTNRRHRRLSQELQSSLRCRDPFIMASLILNRAATKLDCGFGLIIEVDDLLLVLVLTKQCFVEG
ncbi:hypothetical protein ZIOFF_024563 [Zingiber officinale]|uniref:Uncharacterized protein n=1 Tax=Zingiber officinale TaxID=94328 RepID=A0A8J5LJ48_ZINOF|nr:hypothetical protein ZIOFF_024563 [Zingiber officinale]